MASAPTTPAAPAPGAALDLDPIALLTAAFTQAIARAFPDEGATDPSIAATKAAPGKPRFGDFQCNAAMGLSKRVGLAPREVAGRIVAALDLGPLAEPVTPASIAGPGFINITLQPAALGALLARLPAEGLGVLPAQTAETVVVDLCGVNLAKEMHVGHLRSTVIGDTLARVFGRLGHRVIRQNHVGDWGLPIAMVIRRLLDEKAAGRFDERALTLATLETHYKAAQKACEVPADGLETARLWHMGPKIIAELEAGRDPGAADAPAALARAKATLVALQSGDGPTLSMWKTVVATTMASCYQNCARLNSLVTPETDAGESMYRDTLAWVVEDLTARGIAAIDDGALVVRLDDVPPPAGPLDPLLVRKSDGGYLYATTDLAAIRHRVGTLGASRVVYCVDARQGLHFRQVFAAAHKAGYARTSTGAPADLQHAAFGAILGDDGRPFKTRSGESFKLADLLDEAVERAAAAVSTRSAELPEAERSAIARAVAVAAIRYADLAGERTKDYVFALDRMLAFEGNTGPYLLYALVRIRSIFRKAAERGITVDARAAISVKEPAEKTLALALLAYGGAVAGVGESLMPSRLCQYVYDLAGAFSSFFDQCPVLVAADDETRQSRLALCRLSESVLADALSLLGIPTIERM
ncbi:MAG: arginine--tRNA ligase [Phycisphaerales bacterium]